MPTDPLHTHHTFHSIIHLYWYMKASFYPDLCFLMIGHSAYICSCFFRMAQLVCFPLPVFHLSSTFPILSRCDEHYKPVSGPGLLPKEKLKSEPFINQTWIDFCCSLCLTVLCTVITWRGKASNTQGVERLRAALSAPDTVQGSPSFSPPRRYDLTQRGAAVFPPDELSLPKTPISPRRQSSN